MTHKGKVLELLSDGKPHTHMEGYRLGVMLHSRVADLRRDGHDIECWRDGDDYLYRLRPLSTETGDDTTPIPSPVSTLSELPPSNPDGEASSNGEHRDGGGQLALLTVAPPWSPYE